MWLNPWENRQFPRPAAQKAAHLVQERPRRRPSWRRCCWIGRPCPRTAAGPLPPYWRKPTRIDDTRDCLRPGKSQSSVKRSPAAASPSNARRRRAANYPTRSQSWCSSASAPSSNAWAAVPAGSAFKLASSVFKVYHLACLPFPLRGTMQYTQKPLAVRCRSFCLRPVGQSRTRRAPDGPYNRT